MGWNLIEDGYKAGQRVYHVCLATLDDEGEPQYEPYSDQWFTEEEWQALTLPHPEHKEYRLFHRPTYNWWEGRAPSAQEACDKAGWPIGDCWVRMKTPTRDDPAGPGGIKYSGWKTVHS